MYSYIKSDILKPEEKLNIARNNIVYFNAMSTMTSRIMNSVQWFLRNIILINFHIISYHFQIFPSLNALQLPTP